ncbi:MAG: alpha/beta fold hydrolase [Dehalococcoidia bacterium]
MPIEQINGIDLYYESTGEGPVVTFLHGAGGNHISWWQQIPVFGQRYRCITIDHRGFGRSTDPREEGSARYVDDLEALLDRLGIERTALVAQSMGGRTAIGFAVRHPARVTALAMCDTWGFFDWPAASERSAELRASLPEPPARGGLGPRFQREHPAGTFLYQQVLGLNPPRNADAIAAAPGVPTKDQVAALRVPSLFLVGGVDPLVPPEIMRMTAAIVPGAQYAEVPDAGHSVYFEDPGAFNAHVGAFLSAHLSPRPA